MLTMNHQDYSSIPWFWLLMVHIPLICSGISYMGFRPYYRQWGILRVDIGFYIYDGPCYSPYLSEIVTAGQLPFWGYSRILYTSTPPLPFKKHQIPSNRVYKALDGGSLGGLGMGPTLGFIWSLRHLAC